MQAIAPGEPRGRVVSRAEASLAAAATNRRRRVLVISRGAFSGIRDAVLAALARAGCEVVHEPSTLRVLRLRPLYLGLMYGAALLEYGIKFRRYVDHTRMAAWVRSKAAQAIIDRHDDIHAVIGLQRVIRGFSGAKRAGVRYALLTDHVNVLSKQSPDFGLDLPERGVSAAWNETERRALEAQDCTFVLSSQVERCIVEHYGVPASRVTVIGAGPVLDVNAARDGIAKDFSQQNVLFVGLDSQRKGLPQLEAAFERVAAVFPKAKLHVAGVEGKSTPRVTYYGKLSGAPLRDLFYQSQIFAMPSLREPFGLVFLEAMYAKNVCIGTTLGAMPEIIRQGESGFLVQPDDVDALADRIIWLFERPDALRRMAEAGYARARRNYSWDIAAERMLNALFAHESAPQRLAGGVTAASH